MATLTSSQTSSQSQPQSYFMRFSSHSAALSRSLLGLLSESYCTDVHISTGHQSQTIRAHKIILSAFSPYFKSLFSSLPSNQFPVIIIREIQYDILRTIIEFCYRGEILVPRDKLDDIVSAAKFLQIEGAKDFVLPKHQSSHHNSTGSSSAVLNANNRMQINLQQNNQNSRQQSSLIALQQQKQMSLLSRLVQKPPLLKRPAAAMETTDQSMPIISGVRHIDDKEGSDGQRQVKQELIEEELLDEEEEDEDVEEEPTSTTATGAASTADELQKSGIFTEFEEHSTNNKTNNDSNRQSEDSCPPDDDQMDTGSRVDHILAKVPPGTSISIGGDSSSGQQRNDVSNVPTHGSEQDFIEEEEEEYEDEFDEEEDECDPSTNPLDLLNVNMSETDENPMSGTDMSSAAARAIAASTLASFGTNLDLDSEASESSQPSQYGGSPSLTISAVGFSGERRGRGRPPKYEMGTPFSSGQSSTGSATATPIVISAQGTGQTSPQRQQQSITITPSGQTASATSSSSSGRSRRGRPPSMPEELLRSLTGRLDKAHHKCPHCPQIYYGYHAMRDHITSVHLNSGEKYICNLCNKEYTWRITLRKHLKFHHGVHPDQVDNA